ELIHAIGRLSSLSPGLRAGSGLKRVVRRHDGLEPDPARGWSPAGSGRLGRKEVIACVVITRGGSPNGSRRAARRAAARLTITSWLESARSELPLRRIGPGRLLSP